MRHMVRIAAAVGMGLTLAVRSADADETEDRQMASKLEKEGNFQEAYDARRKLALNPMSDPKEVPEDVQAAVRCLNRLNRLNEFDAFVEAVVDVHADNWRLLRSAATAYFEVNHYGFLIAGEFERGQHRGGGQWANAFERDRVRALQLMKQALPLVADLPNKREGFDFYLQLARMFAGGRWHRQSWELQVLTDLSELPDVESGHYQRGGQGPAGAPVDADGNPVFYRVPESFDAAANDGERWRWALHQAELADPARADHPRMDFARFLHQQFGVQTMAQYSALLQPDEEDARAGIFALHTLDETETIAKLATGVKRFNLPDEFNFILIFQAVSETPQGGFGWDTTSTLAQIFENRRQYDKAITWWDRSARYNKDYAQQRIRQITDNWGVFEGTGVQPAGRPATVDFRFRNAAEARFTARRIDVPRLLADVRLYVEDKPKRLDWQKLNVDDIGRRLVQQEETKYLEDEVADWTLRLNPRPNHFDRRISVTTPLREPGAYLLVCKLDDGNTSRIVLQLTDTVLVRKQLDRDILYFVADAVSGAPLEDVAVEFFGYRQDWIARTKRHQIHTRRFAETSDADGQLTLRDRQDPEFSRYSWLVTATRRDGRFAYHGFQGLHFQDWYDREYNATKTYVITDRPVYRPSDPVKFKVWARYAKYDLEDASAFAGSQVSVEIRNPKGDSVFAEAYTADAWGGVDGEWTLGEEPTLGVYSIAVTVNGRQYGGGSFRVEEYKKPEYEVTVEAPSEPVMLGETIPVKVKATYYFGAPVTNATVSVKVLRYNHTAQWYPPMPWDWFYGPGYWWFGYDYLWYPGWRRWGCARPYHWWLPQRHDPPEVVVQTEMPVGPDGTITVDVDTQLAKELHPDMDHRYEITAEVRDESRRTIVGNGQVLVAREPFKITTWTDRGYYRVGETGTASFQARTLDGQGVAGNGVLRLLRVTYDKDMQPVESEEQSWQLDAGPDGRAEQQFTASRPGQYRLAYTLTDKKGHTIEGGYVFVIRGDDFDGRQFRFNQIELVPDRKEYAPGETVNLMINTDRTGGTVVLFLRPSNGIYKPPRILRLEGKSTVVPIEVSKKDMPNFFVEAFTIADGQLFSDVKEIVVPPEKRILNVEVLPSAERYKPGEMGTVEVRVTDEDGKPFSGSAVVTVYDKSVEYISGGSNVPDIKAFFWKWRRHHNEQTFSTLQRWFYNLLKRGETGMANLGVFGHMVADEEMAQDKTLQLGMAMNGARGRTVEKKMRKAGAAEMDMAMDAVAAPAAAMPMLAAAPEADGAPGGGAGAGAGEMVEPTVRTEFADTALWVASLQTGNDGIAGVELPMPENLTTWKISVWGMGHGTKVGQGVAEVITSKDLLLRMQAPRFFVQKDEVVLSANIHNYLADGKSVRAVLELDGPCLEALGDAARTVEIAANGEKRVDWRVKVLEEGEAIVRMKALTDEESDAMEMRFPVYVHGIDKMVPVCGVIRPDQTAATVRLEVPRERRPETTRLELRYSPTLAMAMVDALPYLVSYPYGCTEQTLNRFLPTVITQNVLLDMGVSLEDIREKRTNLNAQELGTPAERAKQWKRYDTNPVFDEAEVRRMVKQGVEDLTNMQLSDGGWGWFSGYGEHSYPHTTALVVHGLQVALDNDVAIPQDVIARGIDWLKAYQADQVTRIKNAEKDPPKHPFKRHADNLDALVYRVLADADVMDAEMRDFLYRDRNELSVYGKALYGLGLEKQAQREKLAMIMRNISQFVVEDEENQTAWLNLGNGSMWWTWYGDEMEAHAAYLKLLCAADPTSKVASRLVKYMLNNRKHATYWRSTRDTAFCVEAFATYIKATGEDKPDMTITVQMDGETRKDVRVTPETLFTFDNTLLLQGDEVSGGVHDLVIRKSGTGPLYYNSYLSYFTLEDFITKAGLEVKVERNLYRLVREDTTTNVAGSRGQAAQQRVERYRREKLANNAMLKSGQLVEIELIIESKNDYEYIVVEDMKAAGFEPVEVRSGYTGNEMGAYVEFRDEKVAFFVRQLARGRHSVSYRLRAEIPGRFSALPTTVSAMYAPELRGNADEFKVRIED